MLAQFIPVSAQVPLGPRPVKLQVPEGETELPAVIRRNPSFPESGAYSERPKLRGKRGTPETILPRKKEKSKTLFFALRTKIPGSAWPLPLGATAVPR